MKYSPRKYGIRKWKPTRAHLKKAWLLKVQGYTNKKIQDALKITEKEFALNHKAFKDYFEQQFEVLKANTTKVGKARTKLLNIDYEKLRLYVLAGFSNIQIAGLFDMAPNTFDTYKVKYPKINQIIKNAKLEATTGVVNGLLANAKDREVEDVYISNYRGMIIKQKYKKNIRGSLAAQKYWLNNILPEVWSDNPQVKSTNNKGMILELLNKAMEDNDNDEE